MKTEIDESKLEDRMVNLHFEYFSRRKNRWFTANCVGSKDARILVDRVAAMVNTMALSKLEWRIRIR